MVDRSRDVEFPSDSSCKNHTTEHLQTLLNLMKHQKTAGQIIICYFCIDFIFHVFFIPARSFVVVLLLKVQHKTSYHRCVLLCYKIVNSVNVDHKNDVYTSSVDVELYWILKH